MRQVLTNAVCLCLMFITGGAQEKSSTNQCPPGITICDPRKTDEYGNLIWSDEKARLDNIAAELKSAPDGVVYLYAYNGRRGCAGEAQARAIRAKNYLVKKHGIQPDRVIWRDGGPREDLTIEVWVEPREATAPYASPTVDPSEAQLRVCRPVKRRGHGRK